MTRKHGILRGLDSVLSSKQLEGRFGRMFRNLPKAHFKESALKALAAKMVSDKGTTTPENENPSDDEENIGKGFGTFTLKLLPNQKLEQVNAKTPANASGISAGYTYLGQFIDHDLTFDPNSSLQKEDDPDSLVDYRTPRFDLDNIYGRGPDDQPYLYREDGKHLLLGRLLTGSNLDPCVQDVPRNNPFDGEDKRALIGDPRNDENVIISQLQAIFIRFHNSMVDLHPHEDFATIQRLVRWHYQWVVLHDFLPTIIGNDTLAQILPHCIKKTDILADKPNLLFYKWDKDPFIPVEFSVAAYRFGHSMVRPEYRLNTNLPNRFDIFSSDPNTSLTGFREFPSDWAIDWQLFFDFGNGANQFSKERIQPAYKIDSSLVNPLLNLPPSIASGIPNLAERNLLRGWRMGLPSGQSVARIMGYEPIPDDQLKVGKAVEDDFKSNPTLVSIDPSFKDNAPLWFYILAEAQQAFADNQTPIRLGPVGGRIVGEVFVGLLLGDHHSFLKQSPKWKPIHSLTKNGKFGIVELISQAIK